MISHSLQELSTHRVFYLAPLVKDLCESCESLFTKAVYSFGFFHKKSQRVLQNAPGIFHPDFLTCHAIYFDSYLKDAK